jgi:cyclopropane-fatty-acyl-phospholipid synthase
VVDLAMNELALDSSTRTRRRLDTSAFPPAARWVVRLLENIRHGTLRVTFPDGQRAMFGCDAPHADITLVNWNVFGASLKRGDVGFAETFIAGDWKTRDLAGLLVVLLRNRAAIEQVIYGSFLGGLFNRMRHLLKRNTREQARKNIHAHYDLGNEFYALWLDRSLTYSSAVFETLGDPHTPADLATLTAAQQAKYARVLAELQLEPGAQVLEIGCGWGGFAQRAGQAGHHVDGLTLSPAQLQLAAQRLAVANVAADLRLQDYREEKGRYDGIASIEMFEAVGEAYWPAYFATLSRCLKPGARACVQTIVIDDALFARYRKSTDFIQQYIFPGGMLPSPSEFEHHANAAGLRVANRFSFGRHYAKTLSTWRASFESQLPAVRALGFDDRFIAIWTFYLAYCEAAFAEGSTDVVQFTLARA